MSSPIRKAARTKFKASPGDAWTKKQQRGAIYAEKAAHKASTARPGAYAAVPLDTLFVEAAQQYLSSLSEQPPETQKAPS